MIEPRKVTRPVLVINGPDVTWLTVHDGRVVRIAPPAAPADLSPRIVVAGAVTLFVDSGPVWAARIARDWLEAELVREAAFLGSAARHMGEADAVLGPRAVMADRPEADDHPDVLNSASTGSVSLAFMTGIRRCAP